jgi:glycosyltransferase involved in cell wall biosynthesis
MISVAYIGLADETGYGVAARNLVSALRQAGASVHWVPMSLGAGSGTGYQPVEPTALPAVSHVIIHTVPEHFPYWRRRVRAELGPDTRLWGHTVWETDALPAHWPPLLNAMDGIIVPCEWNYQVFSRCGVTVPVAVLPHVSQFSGVAPPQAFAVDPALDGRFLFYTVAMWNNRKAPWLALRAFLQSFRASDPVALLIKTSPEDWTAPLRSWRTGFRRRFPSVRPAVARELARFPNPPPVQLIDHRLDDPAMAGLHARGDCFVALPRGEGWGLGAYEAAWFGKPVLTTRHGGSLDFLADDCAYLVNHRLAPVARSEADGSYTTDQHWADPDLSHASALMRLIATDTVAARDRGRRLRDGVAARFSATEIAERCLKIITA